MNLVKKINLFRSNISYCKKHHHFCFHKTFIILTVLFFMCLALGGEAFAFSIDATVDRTKVKFGESLQLVITITQSLTGAPGEKIRAPQVSQIPGFDIVGQHTSHNMTIINGVGQIQVKTAVELVPQQAGEFTIPSLRLQGPDGKIYSTKPIKVTVLPPSQDEDERRDDRSSTDEATSETSFEDQPTRNSASRILKLVLVALFILGSVIGAPIFLTWLMNRGVKPSTRWQDSEPGQNNSSGGKSATAARRPESYTRIEDKYKRPKSDIENAQIAFSTSSRENDVQKEKNAAQQYDSQTRSSATIRANESNMAFDRSASSARAFEASGTTSNSYSSSVSTVEFDFEREVTALQRLHPEANIEFYRAFFDLFKRALLGRSRHIDVYMTPDEIVRNLLQRLPEPVGARLKKLAADWEAVAFANARPYRSWSAVLEDALAVLAAIPSRE